MWKGGSVWCSPPCYLTVEAPCIQAPIVSLPCASLSPIDLHFQPGPRQNTYTHPFFPILCFFVSSLFSSLSQSAPLSFLSVSVTLPFSLTLSPSYPLLDIMMHFKTSSPTSESEHSCLQSSPAKPCKVS